MLEKIIILGTGSIGMLHARLVKKLGYSPVLISVRDSRRRELEGEGYEVAKNLEEVADLAVACIIATETNRHVADAAKAMSLGLRVLVEKPLGVSEVEVRGMAENCGAEALAQLRVVCPLRWYGAISEVKKRLSALGRIHSVNICCQSYLPAWRPNRDYKESYSASPEQGGVVRDLVHEIDYCHDLFGLPDSDKLQVVGSDGGQIGIRSTSNVLMTWKRNDGGLVSIQLDYLTRSARRSLRVYGEHGEVSADLISGEVRSKLAGEEELVVVAEADRDAAMQRMLESFLNNEAGGCNYEQALEVARVVGIYSRLLPTGADMEQ